MTDTQQWTRFVSVVIHGWKGCSWWKKIHMTSNMRAQTATGYILYSCIIHIYVMTIDTNFKLSRKSIWPQVAAIVLGFLGGSARARISCVAAYFLPRVFEKRSFLGRFYNFFFFFSDKLSTSVYFYSSESPRRSLWTTSGRRMRSPTTV